MNNQYHKIIGIDLGTTFSAVSVWDNEKGESIIIPNLEGHPTTPSVVSINNKDEVIVGAIAKRNLVSNPESTIIEIKRLMGERYSEQIIKQLNLSKEDIDRKMQSIIKRKEEANETPPTSIINEPVTVTFRGEEFNPQTISAFILLELKKAAERFIREPIYDAVITVPAYFKEIQKKATEDAARIAQLNPRLLLNEPTAAAVAFGPDKVKEGSKTFLVYDLGGGTFDVSVIEVEEETVTVIGTGGDPHLGGSDFDDAIARWVLDKIKADHGADLSGDTKIWNRIKATSEQAKKDLSYTTSSNIDLPFLTAEINVNYEISRFDFEDMIMEKIKQSLNSVDLALKSAEENNGTTLDDIDMIILVGGSSRIPLVQKMLADKLKKPIRADLNPDEVVALGASIMAKTMDPKDSYEGKIVPLESEGRVEEEPKVTLFDVTGHSLGIALQGDIFHRLIAKDTIIPIEATQGGFTTAMPNQPAVRCAVYQGENDNVNANTFIGEILIDGLGPRPQGYHQFEITFKLDINGVLSTSVKHLNTGRIGEGKFDYDGITRLSQDEIKKLQTLVMDQAGTVPKAVKKNKKEAAPQIPPEYQPLWKRASQLIETLEADKKSKLEAAMKDFEKAIATKDAKLVEEKNNKLMDVFYQVRM